MIHTILNTYLEASILSDTCLNTGFQIYTRNCMTSPYILLIFGLQIVSLRPCITSAFHVITDATRPSLSSHKTLEPQVIDHDTVRHAWLFLFFFKVVSNQVFM